MKTLFAALIILALIAGSFFAGRSFRPSEVPRVDTVVRRDTIRDTLLTPKKVYLARVDTVWMEVPADTVKVPVMVPIEQKEYSTDDYRAIIEGYKPSLISMEVYSKTTIITRTEVRKEPTRPKWGIGVQLGYGIPINGRPAPYIGVGWQYNLVTW